MKRIFSFVLLLTLVFVIILPVSVLADNEMLPYISKVDLVAVKRGENDTDTKNNAIESIKAKGCEYYIDYDFNKYSMGDYVILGYDRTDDESKAIRSLGTVFVKRGETPPETFMSNKIEYKLASDTEFNSGTGYMQVYLYYSTDANAGSPLKELYVEDNYVEPDPDTYPRILINSSDGGKGELDYYESDGCDSKTEDHCYLYRDYNKEYYSQNDQDGERSQDVDTVFAENDKVGSVFSEKPKVVSIVLVSVAILIAGALVVIIVKRIYRSNGNKNT